MIGQNRLVGTDDALDQGDHVGAGDRREVPILPNWQDVQMQIAIILGGRALEAPGMLFQIALGQNGKASCRCFAPVC